MTSILTKMVCPKRTFVAADWPELLVEGLRNCRVGKGDGMEEGIDVGCGEMEGDIEGKLVGASG